MRDDPSPPRGGLLARLSSLFRAFFRRADVESEMAEEFRHHIQLRTRDLIGEGLSPKEARRRARLEFGHVESHREAARTARGLAFVDRFGFSWIDVKLGLRMLMKYPGLTFVAVLALGVGIPVGLAPTQAFRAVLADLPVDGGDRIRAIRYYNVGARGPLGRAASPHELRVWREELTTFASLGAFREASHAIPTREGASGPVSGAEVTASTFDILRVPPQLGRVFDRGDEVPGAADVVVIGHDLWQDRLGGDPEIIGRTLELSGVPHLVIGVMPQDFLFPDNHQLWLPLRLSGSGYPGEGPDLSVFGRLADEVTTEEAEAQVSAIGRRMSERFPEAREGYLAQVVPFALGRFWMPRQSLASLPEFYAMQLPALLLLVVACANVAMLLFARTATRLRELAVRTALGASRLRILSQMFAEALVLALLAAGLGLLAMDTLSGPLREALFRANTSGYYWLDLGVTRDTVVSALSLAVLSAVIAGVAPALKVTGKKVRLDIQGTGSARSRIRFGGLTSGLVVADVAVAMAAVGVVAWASNAMLAMRDADDIVGIPAEEYLSAEVRLPMGVGNPGAVFLSTDSRTRLALTQETLVERLEAEPGVRGIGIASHLPRMEHLSRSIVVDEGVDEHRVLHARVDPGYFEGLRQPVLSGRDFASTDLAAEHRPVIVNAAFVERVLGGRNALGRSVRFTAAPGEEPAWHEIVGVVGHLGMTVFDREVAAGLYLPAAPGELHPLRLAVHVGADPEAFTPRLRQIVAEVDPAATLEATRLSEIVPGDDWLLLMFTSSGLTLLVVVLLALAISGLYAMLSFAVSQRTHEIGVRTALGAGRGHLAQSIVGRALWQIALGVLLGMPVVLWMLFDLRDYADLGIGPGSTVLAAIGMGAVVMMLVALLACAAPTLRALRIEPSEALRIEG